MSIIESLELSDSGVNALAAAVIKQAVLDALAGQRDAADWLYRDGILWCGELGYELTAEALERFLEERHDRTWLRTVGRMATTRMERI